METAVKLIFSGANPAESKRIEEVLKNLGVHSIADLRYLEQSHISDVLRPIEVRKLLALATDEDARKRLTYAVSVTDDHAKTTKDLAIASKVLGGVGAAALPITIFAAMFPPITLPIAIGVGIGTGVVAAAAAGTGIATGVMIHKDPVADFDELRERGGVEYEPLIRQ